MKLSTRNRVVKSYEVQVSGPRLVESTAEMFESLTAHLTVLTVNEEVDGHAALAASSENGDLWEVIPNPEEHIQSNLGSTSPEAIFSALPGGDTDPQAVSNLMEQAPGAIVSTGDYRPRTVSFRTPDLEIEARTKADGILAEAKEQAQAIIRQSEQEALAIVERARAEAESYRAEIAAAVRAEVGPQAEAEGYAAGRQQAEAMARAMLDQANRLLDLAHRAVEEEFRKADEPLVRLAVQISERILRSTLSISPQQLLTIIRTLPLFPEERGDWSLHVSAQDASWLGELPAQLPCPVVRDETLAPGDCYLESGEGIFDARLESELARLEQILVEELRRGGLA